MALLEEENEAPAGARQDRHQHRRQQDLSSSSITDNITIGSDNNNNSSSISPRSFDFLSEEGEAAAGSLERAKGGEDSPLSSKRSTSVKVILERLAVGSTICARGEQWKLTRAVAHLEDAWKGRMSPCPPLEKERSRKLFKLRWKYRWLDFLLVHLFLVLSMLETPAWCVGNEKCRWSCYPDFSRNWHMSTWLSLLIEGLMLVVLVTSAAIDVVRAWVYE